MWGQEDREAGLGAMGKALSAKEPWERHSLFLGLSYCSAKGKKISGQEGKQMSEGKTKQSQALSELPMVTGPLWLEEPLSQERPAGAQSSKGCGPLCLSPINAY